MCQYLFWVVCGCLVFLTFHCTYNPAFRSSICRAAVTGVMGVTSHINPHSFTVWGVFNYTSHHAKVVPSPFVIHIISRWVGERERACFQYQCCSHALGPLSCLAAPAYNEGIINFGFGEWRSRMWTLYGYTICADDIY